MAHVEGRLEVSLLCCLQEGDVPLPCSVTKRDLGGSESPEGCTALLQLLSSPGRCFSWRWAGGSEKGEKEISSFIFSF